MTFMRRPERSFYVYLLTNFTNHVIYTGVTNDLKRRVEEHLAKANRGFTSPYNVWKLICYEGYADVRAAIFREKQIKAGPRRKKVELIERENPEWRDLYWRFE